MTVHNIGLISKVSGVLWRVIFMAIALLGSYGVYYEYMTHHAVTFTLVGRVAFVLVWCVNCYRVIK